jgi:hypothetical protein
LNLYRIGVVATGLFGIWLVVEAVSGSIGLFGFALMEPYVLDGPEGSVDWLRLLISVIVILLALAPGFLMISFRRQITRVWLLPDSEPDAPEIRESVIAKLAFALFGLSLIARGAHIVFFAVGRLMSGPRVVANLPYDLLIPLAFVIAGYLMFRFASPLADRFSNEPRTRLNEPGK